ncbi:MAG: hypothetical protein RIQ36_1675 [Pseudomonadota bacterium]|jgi:hypothetical protein
MPHSSKASESEAPNLGAIEVMALPRRALWGVVGLLLLTVGSMGLAWLWPDMTMLHFLWVAQAVPVLYLLLAWWGTQRTTLTDDAS